MNNTGKEWTALECQVAARMYSEKNDLYGDQARRFFLIAKELGRTTAAIRDRHRKYGLEFGEENTRRHRRKRECDLEQHVVHGVFVPSSVLAERDKRFELQPASTTAVLCGDPLPGYSALDRRQST